MDLHDIIPLYEYQRRWVSDQSRFKMGLWSRQTGKSFSTALEAVLDCIEHKTDWVFLSSGERQSKELMRKAKMHSQALNIHLEESERSQNAKDGTVYKMLEIEFRNGSRILALPANPDTARGHSANVVLDEFAFHQDSRKIWQALFPTITRGFKIRIISTPQGRKNKFYELWSGNPRYTKHRVDIYDAVTGGLPIYDETGEICDPDWLKEALDDEEAWLQEYQCEFLDESTAFITYDLITDAQRSELDEDENPWQGGSTFAGVDIGRKKDLTVYWCLEKIGDVLWSMKKVELQGEKFSTQLQRISNEIKADRCSRVCVDSTGLGMQLSEDLIDMFGPNVIEQVHFRNSTKEELATTLKRRFEDHAIRIPVSRQIREDIHNVKKSVTAAGNIRYSADQNKDGHSDRFWALALAAHAAENASCVPEITVGLPRQASFLYRAYAKVLDYSAY